MKDKAYLKKSQEYLSNGRVQDCINLLKENINDEDILNQILQLEIRYNSLRRRINNGTIEISDSQLEENRISNALLMIISNLAKGRKGFIPNDQAKKQFDFKLIIIGILALSLLGIGLIYFGGSEKVNPHTENSNPCENIICQNNGVCENGKCICPEGYEGVRCEKKTNANTMVDPCENIRCQNGGTCINGKCDCPEGYTGSRCQTKKTNNIFKVNEATLKASSRKNRGECPKKIAFSGRISTIGGSGTVSYRFIRNDGAKGPVQSLKFDGPGSKTVSTSWRLGGVGKSYDNYWEAIKILEPNEMESNKAYFSLDCEKEEKGFRIIEATLRADPRNYSGQCPKKITFSGRISTIGGSGTVSYRFIRKDGAKGPVQSLQFDGPGSKTVSTSWRLGGAGKSYDNYWEAIKILEPKEMESNKAYFSLICK